MAGLPYLAMWIFLIVSGFVADFLRTRKILETTNIRKVFNAVGELNHANYRSIRLVNQSKHT